MFGVWAYTRPERFAILVVLEHRIPTVDIYVIVHGVDRHPIRRSAVELTEIGPRRAIGVDRSGSLGQTAAVGDVHLPGRVDRHAGRKRNRRETGDKVPARIVDRYLVHAR